LPDTVEMTALIASRRRSEEGVLPAATAPR
jgi:hypothetical protein